MTPICRTNSISLCKTLFVAFVLGCLSGIAHAQDGQFRYQYISLNELIPPLSGFGFVSAQATGINDKGQVALTINYCKEAPSAVNRTCTQFVGLYENGIIQLLQENAASGPINNKGVIGGGLVNQGSTNFLQGALFRKGALPEIIPQRGLRSSFVSGLSNYNTALIVTKGKAYLYKKGRLKKLNLKPPKIKAEEKVALQNLHINNKDTLAGAFIVSPKNPDTDASTWGQAFRYNWHTGKKNYLNPLSSDAYAANISGINDTGEALGESRSYGEISGRIGIWDRYGKFHVYVDQLGSKESPGLVKRLLLNNQNLIVLNNVSESGFGSQSYLMPAPGLRLPIGDLIINRNDLPVGQSSSADYTIFDINNLGDFVGYTESNNQQNAFILLRL